MPVLCCTHVFVNKLLLECVDCLSVLLKVDWRTKIDVRIVVLFPFVDRRHLLVVGVEDGILEKQSQGGHFGHEDHPGTVELQGTHSVRWMAWKGARLYLVDDIGGCSGPAGQDEGRHHLTLFRSVIR